MHLTLFGHVDAGKSTFGGHYLLKHGVFSEQEMKNCHELAIQNKMEGWRFAYLLDVDEHEQLNGKTSDCIHFEFKINEKKFILTDTPGHHYLIPKMISGADETDIGLFVISMKNSEFDKCLDDTEHLLLLRCLGIKHLIVILNKIDLASEIEDKRKKITNLIRKIGFPSKITSYVDVNSLSGFGFDKIDEIISNIPIENEISKINIQTTKIVLDGIVLGNLITPGFLAVLHGKKIIINIEVESVKIDNIESPFVRKDKRCCLTIKLPTTTQLISDRFILRVGDKTVFLGKLII